jgi:mono/diheme cytochrome c family protein
LKDWTDDEIARAITKGINRNGDTLFPLMPYHSFSRLTRDDIYSVIAYLRTLPSLDSVKPKRQLAIPPSMFGPLPANDIAQNVKPDPSDKVNYGRYMITAAACGECHTPRTPQGAPIFERAYSGGFVFRTPFFNVAVANITPDSATGIGTWTEDAFVQKFRTNASEEVVNRNPGRMNTIMPWEQYGKMKDEDLRAIYAFLRTVPPINNKVEKWPQ